MVSNHQTRYDAHIETGHHFYSAGTDRVIKKLRQYQIPVADTVTLNKVLMDFFDSEDYIAAQLLNDPESKADWHSVTFPDVSPLSDLAGQCYSAHSLLTGMAGVMEEADRQNVFITGGALTENGVRLLAGDQEVVAIERIQYEAFSYDIRCRVRETLKGIRSYGERERMKKRLAKLPGFDKLEWKADHDRNREPRGSSLLPFPSNWSTMIRKALASCDIPVAQHQAQELAAVYLGMSSWHELNCHETRFHPDVPPCSLSIMNNGKTQHLFFRSPEEALFSMGRFVAEQKEPMIGEGMSHYPMSGGLYAAAESADGRIRVSSCDVTQVDFFSNFDGSHMEVATELLDALKTNGGVSKILGESTDFDSAYRAAKVRQGTDPGNVLKIGDQWLTFFTIGDPDGHSSSYLSLETPHREDKNRNTFPLYKTSLVFDDQAHTLEIHSEYRSTLSFVVEGVSLADVERIVAITSSLKDDKPSLWDEDDIRNV